MTGSGIYTRWRNGAPLRRRWVGYWLISMLLTVVSLPSFAVAANLPIIAAGHAHTCALSGVSGGSVSCWGVNTNGQLGDGTTTNRLTPITVPGLTGVTALAAGGAHTCALIGATGGVKCWGFNSSGQLGNGTTTQSATPVDVIDGLSLPIVGVAEITAGRNHTCARFSTGGLLCWGENSVGQVGDGTLINRSVASNVAGFASDVARVSAGFAHTCFVQTSTSQVRCFGENIYGALGNGSTLPSAVPMAVSGISNAVEVSAGDRFTCARLSDNSVRCWGQNDSGGLGDGTTTNSSVPVSVGSSPLSASIVDAGGGNGDTEKFACAALSANGQVQCWGSGASGTLGNGAETQQTLPVNVTGLTQVVALSTGSYHSCAWIGTCTIKCWGDGSQGRLGNGDTANKNTPVEVRTCQDPTPTPTPNPPDACRSEKKCVPDPNLTTPLEPRAPQFVTVPKPQGSSVTLTVGSVVLGVPISAAKRSVLKKRLEKFLGTKITSLEQAIRSLQVFYVFSVVRVSTTAELDVDTSALPNRFRADTRKRRVTARLGPGTYVATASVRVKSSSGKVFSTSQKSASVTFKVK